MAQQTINIGASPNDGTGTPLRTSFDYTNQNFTELYTAVGPSGNNIVVPGTATITGDLTVDTSTLKVDSTNNRVGIGTASPIGPLDIRSNGDTAALFLRTTDPAAAVASAYIKAPVSTGFSSTVPVYGFWYQNSGMGNPAADTLNWIIASNEAMRLNSTANLVLKGGTAAANGVGVTFPATQVASSDANCLDDYEEGTWTPVVTAVTGTLTSVTGQTGTYTKIGRMVTATGFFTITTNGTGSSAVALAGLPFANGGLSNIGVGRVDGTTGNMFQVKIVIGSATAIIWTYDNNYPGADGAQFPMTLVYYV